MPSPDLQDLWQAAAEAAAQAKQARTVTDVPQQFLLLLTCRDEAHRVDLLQRFQNEGLPCKALLS